MNFDKPPPAALPALPAAPAGPPIPGMQAQGTKPQAKSQTNLSWLNTSTGKAAGAAAPSSSGSPVGAKSLTGQ